MPIICRTSQQCCEGGIFMLKFQIRRLRLRKLNFLKDTQLGNNGMQASMHLGLLNSFTIIRLLIFKTPSRSISVVHLYTADCWLISKK